MNQSKPNLQYVFVTQRKILIRRLAGRVPDSQTIKLRADNPDYKSRDLELSQALEIWEVKRVFITHLRPPALLDEQVADLERKLKALAERIRDKD